MNTYIQAKEFYLQERANEGLATKFSLKYTPAEKKSMLFHTQDKSYWVLKNSKGELLSVVDINDLKKAI